MYNLTPEVLIANDIKFLIRIDNEELVFVDTEEDAKLVIDSVAAAEVKRLTDEWTRVYRLDEPSGKKIVLSTQAIGRIIDGYVVTTSVVDYIPVSCAKLIRGRHERGISNDEIKSKLKTLRRTLEGEASVIL